MRQIERGFQAVIYYSRSLIAYSRSLIAPFLIGLVGLLGWALAFPIVLVIALLMLAAADRLGRHNSA